MTMLGPQESADELIGTIGGRDVWRCHFRADEREKWPGRFIGLFIGTPPDKGIFVRGVDLYHLAHFILAEHALQLARALEK